ncbi:MAG TPA: 7TM diverse intracellular signaling domain-containing protein [Pseudomonadales bacterium]|nr:7TM diverse intracellular signaling domain-containing protein [Pseudomonadales bacterium]
MLTLGALLFFFLLCGFRLATAQTGSNPASNPQNFSDSVYYVLDKERTITADQALKDTRVPWVKANSAMMNFGIEPSPIWIKFKLTKSQKIEKLLLEVAATKFDSISFWLFTDNESNTLENKYDVNGNAPIKQRPVYSRNFVFPLQSSNTEDKTILLRLQTNYQLRVPLYIWTIDQYYRETNLRTLFEGFYFGVVVIMAFYNLCIFFYGRDKSYGTYSLFILFIAGFVATERGISSEYFWADHPDIDFPMALVLTALGAGISLPFTSYFLSLNVNAPKIDRAYRYFFRVWMCVAVLAAVFPQPWILYLLVTLIVPGGSSLFVVGFLMWRKGVPAAPFFTIAWAIFVNSAISYNAFIFGLLPISPLTEYSLQIGNMIEVTVLSLGLANRIKTLSQEKQAAAMLSTAKSDFLATMSHEIRTPMNGILGMAELLGDTKLSSQQSTYLNTILSSGQTLLTVLNDILDYSKIESGKFELESITFDVRSTLSDATNVFSVKAKEKSLYYNIYVAADVPASMRGDPVRIKQVISNLVNNAFKFTKEGSVTVSVSRPERDHLLFEVKDSGIGIPPDKQASIFEKFTQADSSTSRQFGGTGLGLSISKRFVQAMGGDIGVRSEVGAGSTFWFTLPIRDELAYGASLETSHLSRIRNAMLISPDSALLDQWSGYADYWHCKLETKVSLSAAHRALSEENAACDILVIDQHCSDFKDSILNAVVALAQTKKIQLLFLLETGTSRNPWENCSPPAWFEEFPLSVNRLQSRFTAETSAPTDAKKPGDELPNLSMLKILVVDDNQVNSLVIKGFLKKLQIQPQVVDSGQAALDTVFSADTPFDLILMDCEMPEIDGYLATEKIREWELTQGKQRTPICALSAHAMDSYRQKCFRSGMDDFLSKPINFEQLIEKLQHRASTKAASNSSS